MELIKLDDDRYFVKDSQGKILSKKEVIILDIESDKCVKGLYKGILKNANKSVKKTKQSSKSNN